MKANETVAVESTRGQMIIWGAFNVSRLQAEVIQASSFTWEIIRTLTQDQKPKSN